MSMADSIKAHSELEWEDSTGKAFCTCGVYLCLTKTPIHSQYNKLYEHAADELAKAGYGNVQEAKAEALMEAAKDLTSLPYAKPDALDRAHYERTLAVRRGNTDTWLKERAERIKENP